MQTVQTQVRRRQMSLRRLLSEISMDDTVKKENIRQNP